MFDIRARTASLRRRLSPLCPHARSVLRLALVLLLLPTWVQAQLGARPEVLIVYSAADPVSTLDARGIREALAAQRTPFLEVPLAAGARLPESLLATHTALVLADVQLQPDDALAVAAWLEEGGGLFASGRAALGLETALGIRSVQALVRTRAGLPALDEIRFGLAHPASTGSFWSGPINQVPPMPGSELPAVPQLYNGPDFGTVWPAYTASADGAQLLARWRARLDAWTSADAAPAVFAHQPGQGRALWYGALPGVYAEAQFPLGWHTPIQEGIAWIQQRGAVIQLGHWPQGRRAAYAFSADTESAVMRSAVPSLLEIFERLQLGAFGTFFLVGQAGGAAGTEGAQENPQVVQALLAAQAEVAGHGDVHLRFKGQELAAQEARIDSMRDLVESSTSGVPALLGMRAPYLDIDRNTWRAAAGAGLAYDSSDQDVWCECSLPWWTGEVWSLPPTAPMDYILLDQAELSGAQLQVLMADKAAYVASRRGLFNWVTHPWVLEGRTATDISGPPIRPGVLAEVEAILRAARDDGGFWMQRLDTILAWWLQRERLQLDVVSSSPQRLQLRLRNPADAAVREAALWLRLPPADFPWRFRLDGQPVQPLSRSHGLGQPSDYRVLVVPQLDAFGEALIELDLDLPAELFEDGFEG